MPNDDQATTLGSALQEGFQGMGSPRLNQEFSTLRCLKLCFVLKYLVCKSGLRFTNSI
jgi:hypothetical protein